MNTEPATAAQKLAQHGGVWVGLDKHLFKKRIERLAVLAGHIDFTKAAIPDDELLAEMETESGPIPPELLEEARELWQGPAEPKYRRSA